MNKCHGKECKKPVRFEIDYDWSIESQTLLLCDYHFNLDPVFQRHIKNLVEIKN